MQWWGFKSQGSVMEFERTIAELSSLSYQAALDANKWQTFCDRLSRVTGTRVALHGRDQVSGLTFGMMTANYDLSYIDTYLRHYGAISPWMSAIHAVPIGVVQSSEAILPFEELARSGFYNEWLLPQEDLSTGGGVTLFREDGRCFRLSCNMRIKDREKGQSQLIALLEHVAPHMIEALNLSRRLAGIPVGEELTRALDLPNQAIALLDGSGRLAYANRHFERLLGASDLVSRQRGGRLAVSDPGAARAIAAFLAQSDTPRKAQQLNLTLAGRRSRSQATIAPFDSGAFASPLLEVVLERRPTAILCVELPVLGQDALCDALARRHDLTPAEAQVAYLIYSGYRPRTVAAIRGISSETVRSQLKAAFGKLGVGSQSGLCAVLDALARGPEAQAT